MNDSVTNYRENITFLGEGKITAENCAHYSYEIRELMLPLLMPHKIHYFYHERIFNDGTKIVFTTNPEAVTHVHQNNHPWICNRYDATVGFDHFIWINTEGDDREKYEFYAKNFNLANGLTLIEKCNGYWDFFHFGADYYDTYMTDFLSNNIPLLKYFSAYYKNNFKKIINNGEVNCIYKPHHKIDLSKIDLSVKRKNNFLPPHEEHHLSSSLLFGDIKLRKREYEILHWLAHGKTAEEMAIILSISKRTVETHIKYIKEKFDCRNVVALAAKAASLGIIHVK